MPVSTLVGLIAGPGRADAGRPSPRATRRTRPRSLRTGLDQGAARAWAWQPVLALKDTVGLTVAWYRAAVAGGDRSMYDLSVEQIRDYEKRARLAR